MCQQLPTFVNYSTIAELSECYINHKSVFLLPTCWIVHSKVQSDCKHCLRTIKTCLMAYAALVSLKHTIDRLLNHSPRISIPSFNLRILEDVYKYVCLTQRSLVGLQYIISRMGIDTSISSNWRELNVIFGVMREAAYRLDDAIESRLSNEFLISQSHEISFGDDFKEVLAQVWQRSLLGKDNKMLELISNFVEEQGPSNPWLPEKDDANSMVGLSDEFNKIKDLLIKDGSARDRDLISLVGMAGIGKTALARKLFEDPSIMSHFECRAFVRVGPNYQTAELYLAILAQISHATCKVEDVVPSMLRCLKGVKYLIVLDDVWDERCLELLGKLYLATRRKGSRILLTTRLQQVAEHATLNFHAHQLRFLNKEESLYLLRERVFGEDQVRFPDEKAAENIAEICGGLPLAIIAVADLLAKAEKQMPEYWKKMADKGNSIFLEVDEGMYEVLISSYKYLPQHLKACFLYLGAFPPNWKIPASKLTKFWSAERFLEANSGGDLEDFARKSLEDLVSNSLVLVRQKRFNISGTKICEVHIVYWYLCVREAEKENFLHVLNCSTQGIEKQRRLCIHNNVLFGIKEVYDSMETNISIMHSLLCTGPYHQHPVPICFPSKLLRVVDALTIRFYNFPIEVVELLHLRFLALTYNGKIPASISKLWNLEYLIVHQHLRVVPAGARSYLPIEIWDMQKLSCLQVMGSDLIPQNGDSGALLSNLLTLSYMSPHSCTKEILEKTPNLKRLGIQIELAPDFGDDDHPLHCFDHLGDHLHQLETLKCVVVNPDNPMSQIVAFPATNFPSSVKKLSLSGLGYPWEYMRVIAQLPNLEMLKLRCYAFRGPLWDTYGYEFRQLKFLLLEDTDLEYWKICLSCFPSLKRVIVRHCYNLREIPVDISLISGLEGIEVVDCPLALASVKEMKERSMQNEYLQVSVQSSWHDKKPESHAFGFNFDALMQT